MKPLKDHLTSRTDERQHWRYLRSGYGSRNADFDIVNNAGGRIASTPYEHKAILIVRACNSHDELVAALELSRDCLAVAMLTANGETLPVYQTAYAQARSALKKAKGE